MYSRTLSADTTAPEIDLSAAGSELSKPPSTLYLLFSFAARAIACSVCLQAAFTLVSSFNPLLELASHCCMHALIVGLVLLPLIHLIGDKGLVVVLGVCVAYLVFVTQPWALVPIGNAGVAKDETSIKVLSWNVLVSNPSSDTIRNLIVEADPDVIVLIEVRPGLIDSLELGSSAYPTIVEQPSWGGEGIAVLSRVPDTQVEFLDFEFEYQPGVLAKLSLNGKTVKLVGLHTLSPVPLYRAAVRDRQIESVCSWASKQTVPVCICGDFNTTPWTRPFQRLLESGFVDSRRQVGNCPSWPAPLGVFGIPIDHVLTKGDCRVFNRTVIRRDLGSDHFPVQFEVVF